MSGLKPAIHKSHDQHRQSNHPGHPRPVTIKPVSRIQNQRFEHDTGKMQKMQKVPQTLEKRGSEEIPRSKKMENAAWGFPAETSPKSQAPRKAGAAVSGPRIAGGKLRS